MDTKKIKQHLKQPSTVKGLALVGAGVALATGHPEVFTATVSEAGVQYGGIVGAVMPLVVGAWEFFRNEFK